MVLPPSPHTFMTAEGDGMFKWLAVGAMVLAVAVAAAGLWLGGLEARAQALEQAAMAAQIIKLSALTGWAQLQHAIERALARSPVAIIGVGFGLALPVLGIIACAIRGLWRMAQRFGAKRRDEPRTDMQAATANDKAPPSPRTGPVRPGPGWLDVTRPAPRQIPLASEIHRIGQDADSDLRIDGPDISGTHALIRRTPEREFHLIDVSGGPLALIAVNGELKRQVKLRDGDRIAVGSTQAVFRHGFISTSPENGLMARSAPESSTTP